MLHFRLPQTEDSHLYLKSHVVDLDVLLIIGLDNLKTYAQLVDYVNETLHYRNLNYARPLSYKFGRLFFRMERTNNQIYEG